MLERDFRLRIGKRAPPTRQRADKFRREEKMPNRDETDGPDEGETPDSVAEYIASLAEELSKIAKRNGLETLSHILEMARLEADQAAKH